MTVGTFNNRDEGDKIKKAEKVINDFIKNEKNKEYNRRDQLENLKKSLDNFISSLDQLKEIDDNRVKGYKNRIDDLLKNIENKLSKNTFEMLKNQKSEILDKLNNIRVDMGIKNTVYKNNNLSKKLEQDTKIQRNNNYVVHSDSNNSTRLIPKDNIEKNIMKKLEKIGDLRYVREVSVKDMIDFFEKLTSSTNINEIKSGDKELLKEFMKKIGSTLDMEGKKLYYNMFQKIGNKEGLTNNEEKLKNAIENVCKAFNLTHKWEMDIDKSKMEKENYKSPNYILEEKSELSKLASKESVKNRINMFKNLENSKEEPQVTRTGKTWTPPKKVEETKNNVSKNINKDETVEIKENVENKSMKKQEIFKDEVAKIKELVDYMIDNYDDKLNDANKLKENSKYYQKISQLKEELKYYVNDEGTRKAVLNELQRLGEIGKKQQGKTMIAYNLEEIENRVKKEWGMELNIIPKQEKAKQEEIKEQAKEEMPEEKKQQIVFKDEVAKIKELVDYMIDNYDDKLNDANKLKENSKYYQRVSQLREELKFKVNDEGTRSEVFKELERLGEIGSRQHEGTMMAYNLDKIESLVKKEWGMDLNITPKQEKTKKEEIKEQAKEKKKDRETPVVEEYGEDMLIGGIQEVIHDIVNKYNAEKDNNENVCKEDDFKEFRAMLISGLIRRDIKTPNISEEAKRAIVSILAEELRNLKAVPENGEMYNFVNELRNNIKAYWNLNLDVQMDVIKKNISPEEKIGQYVDAILKDVKDKKFGMIINSLYNIEMLLDKVEDNIDVRRACKAKLDELKVLRDISEEYPKGLKGSIINRLDAIDAKINRWGLDKSITNENTVIPTIENKRAVVPQKFDYDASLAELDELEKAIRDRQGKDIVVKGNVGKTGIDYDALLKDIDNELTSMNKRKSKELADKYSNILNEIEDTENKLKSNEKAIVSKKRGREDEEVVEANKKQKEENKDKELDMDLEELTKAFNNLSIKDKQVEEIPEEKSVVSKKRGREDEEVVEPNKKQKEESKDKDLGILTKASSNLSITDKQTDVIPEVDKVEEKLGKLVHKIENRKQIVSMAPNNISDELDSVQKYMDKMNEVINNVEDNEKPKYNKYADYIEDTAKYLNDNRLKKDSILPKDVSHETPVDAQYAGVTVNPKDRVVQCEKNNNINKQYDNFGENKWQIACRKEIDKTELKKTALEIVEKFIADEVSKAPNIKSYDIVYGKNDTYRLQIIKEGQSEVETYYINREDFLRNKDNYKFALDNEKNRFKLKDPDTIKVPELGDEIGTLGNYIMSLNELRKDMGMYKEDLGGVVNKYTNEVIKDSNGNYQGKDSELFKKRESFIDKMNSGRIEHKENRNKIIGEYKSICKKNKDYYKGKTPTDIIGGIRDNSERNKNKFNVLDNTGNKTNRTMQNTPSPKKDFNLND